LRWLSYCRAKAGGNSMVMLVYPREVLQNRLLHNEETNMQDKSAQAARRLLRVAASFNPSIERTSPGKPGAASHVKRWASKK